MGIKTKIMEYFFTYPSAKLRVREIERVLQLPLPSVIRYCREMEEEGVLSALKIGSVVFYTAYATSEKYLLEKKLYNIRKISESGLVSYLKQELSNPPIILFGSFSRGEDIEQSDIDLYVETSSKKGLNLNKFEKLLSRKIQLFRHKSLNAIGNPHLANNIINGLTLNNYVEVFK